MLSYVSPVDLQSRLDGATPPVLVDVRKTPARTESGLMIAGSERHLADQADIWGPACGGAVVVYCVHGHEVSQGACAALRAIGVDAAYLEGGIEGWQAAGLPVVAIGGAE